MCETRKGDVYVMEGARGSLFGGSKELSVFWEQTGGAVASQERGAHFVGTPGSQTFFVAAQRYGLDHWHVQANIICISLILSHGHVFCMFHLFTKKGRRCACVEPYGQEGHQSIGN